MNSYLKIQSHNLQFRYKLKHPPLSDLGGLKVACWPLVTKFVGSNPAEAVGFFILKKSSAHLPRRGSKSPSVPCRRFEACKRTPKSSVNSLLSGQIYQPFPAQYFHLSLLESLASLWCAGRLVVQVGTSIISLQAAVHPGASAIRTQH
jgi:hypothetical protein